MQTTIIYITGVYDTLDLFTQELKNAFESMGYASFTYDARLEEVSKQALIECIGDGAKKDQRFFCVTFNNLGYNLSLPAGMTGTGMLLKQDIFQGTGGSKRAGYTEKEPNLWETYEIPYINILMDHPFHYEKPLQNAPATSVVLCTDRNHVRYIRRYFKNIRYTDVLPHAGVELGSRHKPLAERGIDVLYAGALPIYTVAKMIPDLSSIPEVDGEEMAQVVLSELVRHPDRTTEDVIEEYLKYKRNDISEKRVHEIIVQMRFIDSYATSFFREQAVRILVENGIRVTAYGTGWDQCEWSDNPYLVYGGKVLAPEILPLMNDSKIVLNTMTWFKAGAHDRICAENLRMEKNLSCFQEMRSGLCQTVYLTCLATCSPHKRWQTVDIRQQKNIIRGKAEQRGSGKSGCRAEVLIPSLQQVLHTDENVILADTAQEWRLLCTY